MNENMTAIHILLDRSGSMFRLQDDVIEGINAFLQDQKEEEGEAIVSLVQFDDRYEENYLDKSLSDAPNLTHETYKPRGATALLDSLGKLATSAKERMNTIPEALRPAKNIVVVFTDGQENASDEFSHKDVAKLVRDLEDEHHWKFIFLGANIDSFGVGAQIGVTRGKTANYSASKKGIRSAVYAASTASRSLRRETLEGYNAAEDVLGAFASVEGDLAENLADGTIFDVSTSTAEDSADVQKTPTTKSNS